MLPAVDVRYIWVVLAIPENVILALETAVITKIVRWLLLLPVSQPPFCITMRGKTYVAHL